MSTVTTTATATTATATAAPTIVWTPAATTSAASAISATIAAGSTRFTPWLVAIEVRLAALGFFGELCATFDRHRWRPAFRRRLATTHLRALLFQNRFAR